MKNLQPIYDAIKLARESGEAQWVTLHKERLRIVPLIWSAEVSRITADGSYIDESTYIEALVRSNRRGKPKIVVDAFQGYKDVGNRLRSHFTGRMIGWDDILAIVTERHPRAKETV